MSKDSSRAGSSKDSPPQQSLFKRLIYGRAKAKKDFSRPARVISTTLIVFIASQFLAAIFLGLVLSLTHPDSNVVTILEESTSAQFFYILLAEGVAVGAVLLLLHGRNLSHRAIGLIRPRFSDVWKGLLGFAVFYGLLIFIVGILLQIFPGIDTDQQQDIGFQNLDSSSDTVLAFVALALIPPIGEEVLIRGYLFSGLRSQWRFVKAGLVTSLIFGVAHLQLGSGAPLWLAAIDTFVLSLVLVYLREKTGALYAGMLVHALNNMIAFGVRFHLGWF